MMLCLFKRSQNIINSLTEVRLCSFYSDIKLTIWTSEVKIVCFSETIQMICLLFIFALVFIKYNEFVKSNKTAMILFGLSDLNLSSNNKQVWFIFMNQTVSSNESIQVIQCFVSRLSVHKKIINSLTEPRLW